MNNQRDLFVLLKIHLNGIGHCEFHANWISCKLLIKNEVRALFVALRVVPNKTEIVECLWHRFGWKKIVISTIQYHAFLWCNLIFSNFRFEFYFLHLFFRFFFHLFLFTNILEANKVYKVHIHFSRTLYRVSVYNVYTHFLLVSEHLSSYNGNKWCEIFHKFNKNIKCWTK